MQVLCLVPQAAWWWWWWSQENADPPFIREREREILCTASRMCSAWLSIIHRPVPECASARDISDLPRRVIVCSVSSILLKLPHRDTRGSLDRFVGADSILLCIVGCRIMKRIFIFNHYRLVARTP
ncbi:hypothetical protein B0O99DRAFT_643858 [Bisporella sp. PMI_857]|nr:hypothetical protein B0O99DRAFT_643858 [Bisporella sp. PMI_857]